MLTRSALRLMLILSVLTPTAIAGSLSDARSSAIDLTLGGPTLLSAVSKPFTVPNPTAPVVVSAPAAPKPAAAITVTAVVPAYSTDWSASTPVISQGNLLGGYACAPTSLAMITAHYSSRYAVGSRSTQEFIDNLKPSEFVPGEGVPYQKLARQLAELGYVRVYGHTGNSKQQLTNHLQNGPMIVTAGGTVAGAKASHSLVVTAISSDGGWVKLNDPADGRNHTISWNRFDALWAGGSRGILIVQP